MSASTADFKWMNSHRGHREHREIIMSSVFSVPSVANSLHTFENWHRFQKIPPSRGKALKPSRRSYSFFITR